MKILSYVSIGLIAMQLTLFVLQILFKADYLFWPMLAIAVVVTYIGLWGYKK